MKSPQKNSPENLEWKNLFKDNKEPYLDPLKQEREDAEAIKKFLAQENETNKNKKKKP